MEKRGAAKAGVQNIGDYDRVDFSVIANAGDAPILRLIRPNLIFANNSYAPR